MSQFQFFKSGDTDTASNIQLAILNNIFPSNPTVNNLTTSSAPVVGLSNNTIASTAPIATGSPITFTFNNLPLVYGNDYAAMFVNVGTRGGQAAIGIGALDANYVDIGGGSFHPATNYGTEDQFSYATSNFINGSGFFNTFSFAGDADFFGNDRYRARTGLLGFTLNGNGRIGLEAAEATERIRNSRFASGMNA